MSSVPMEAEYRYDRLDKVNQIAHDNPPIRLQFHIFW